ncbi:MAG TPA: hypothetical protein DCG79_00810 [Clostridiales bacterium]|nr:hypothetical protein [Clostridiales bacterium]
MSKLICKDFTVKYFGYDAAISSVTTTFTDGINVIYAAEKGGKTTFLKALAGIVPFEGELTLDGTPVSELSLKDRDFQMLFDDYAVFSRRSVRYNLEYPLRLRKVPKEERRRLIEDVAPLFDLDIMLDAPFYRLNEWLKVTLTLCRAYLRRAKVLLIDNIFSKLSPSLRKEAFLRFMPLFKNGIVVYATDSSEEAAALSRDIKFLSYGYLMQEGSVEAFKTKPNAASAFVTFENYPTLLPCVLTQNGVEIGGRSFSLDLKPKSDVYIGKKLLAGIAPEGLVLTEEGFEAIVVGKFYRNGSPVYSANTEDGSVFFLGEEGLAVGATVKLKAEKVVALFDALNERNILEVTE